MSRAATALLLLCLTLSSVATGTIAVRRANWLKHKRITTNAVSKALNPFAGSQFYNFPSFEDEVKSAMAADPALAASTNMKIIQDVPTAYWLDKLAKLPDIKTNMDIAVSRLCKQPAGTTMVIAFVVYDIPNRDCAAYASNVELKIAQDGLNIYKTQYIDGIYNALLPYATSAPNLRVVLFVEPDSLPNIATNDVDYKWPNDPYIDLSRLPDSGAACRAAAPTYFQAAAYAIQKLSSLSNTFLYLDIGHRGWLGYPLNLVKGAHVFKHTLALAGGWVGDPLTSDPDLIDSTYWKAGAAMIRGFVSNVANSEPTQGGTTVVDQYDIYTDEASFANGMLKALDDVSLTGMKWVIDTGRNGVNVYAAGHEVPNWCNIPGAGLGQRPTANVVITARTAYDNYKATSPKAVAVNVQITLDAVYWVKTPGESDGTSDTSSARFDAFCGTAHQAMQGAPEAGVFWIDYFKMLATNANPVFTSSDLPCGGCPAGVCASGSCVADSVACGNYSQVNACATNNGGCGLNAACTPNLYAGTATCSCTAGYAGTPPNCVVSPCATSNGGCGDATTTQCSVSATGAAVCSCLAGYAGSPPSTACTKVNACATNNGGCGDATTTQCTPNALGAAVCACKSPYTGNPPTTACALVTCSFSALDAGSNPYWFAYSITSTNGRTAQSVVAKQTLTSAAIALSGPFNWGPDKPTVYSGNPTGISAPFYIVVTDTAGGVSNIKITSFTTGSKFNCA